MQVQAGITNGTFERTVDRGSDLTEKNLNKFLKKWGHLLDEYGFEVVDNYDVFGYKGRAIVKKGDILYGGKYTEVEGKDIVRGVNSDRRDLRLKSLLEELSASQKQAFEKIDALLKQEFPGNPGAPDIDVSKIEYRLDSAERKAGEIGKGHKGKAGS